MIFFIDRLFVLNGRHKKTLVLVSYCGANDFVQNEVYGCAKRRVRIKASLMLTKIVVDKNVEISGSWVRAFHALSVW